MKNRAKAKPIERVYKDGREAIIVPARKKALSLKAAASRISRIKKILPQIKSETRAYSRPIKVNEYELPSYDVTRLTLLVKDPYWIYVYWEISKDSVETASRNLGGSLDNCKYILRIYEVTYKDFNGVNANYYFDIEVGPHTNNWYINLWSDNACFCGELGVLSSSGRFIPLARSNFVHTPKSGSSCRFDQIWMEARPDFGDRGLSRGNMVPAGDAEECPKSRVTPSSKKRKRGYLSEEDIRRYYSNISPLLREIIFSRLSKRRIYRDAYLRGDSKEWLDFVYMHRLSQRVLRLGSSEFMFLGASESLNQAASEFIKPSRKFFFEIGTELIVYGRTEPDAEVWLGNKKINLHKDGTFSMRFALPDGKIPLDFTAISKNKLEQRKISAIVERKTK